MKVDNLNNLGSIIIPLPRQGNGEFGNLEGVGNMIQIDPFGLAEHAWSFS